MSSEDWALAKLAIRRRSGRNSNRVSELTPTNRRIVSGL
jgi:hypothetical protein